jgi:hypothetical protein
MVAEGAGRGRQRRDSALGGDGEDTGCMGGLASGEASGVEGAGVVLPCPATVVITGSWSCPVAVCGRMPSAGCGGCESPGV